MKNTPKRRELKTRATDQIAPRPISISDRTCAPLAGLEPRKFRDIVAAKNIPHIRVGDRIVVLVAEFEKFIERESASSDAATPLDVEDTATDDVDSILAKLGRRRVRGA